MARAQVYLGSFLYAAATTNGFNAAKTQDWKSNIFVTTGRLVYNKFTNIRQHNNYLLDHIGYMFRPVNRLSSGLQQNKSKVLLRNWDPKILHSCKHM